MTSTRRIRGFTVVELLLVVTVIGILSFVAMGRLSSRAELAAQGYAQQLASTLRLAHKAAVAQRRTVYVNVDAAHGRVRVCLDAAPACASPLPAPGGGPAEAHAPAGVTLAAPLAQFSFDPLGRPSIAASIQLKASGGGANFTVTVERESGYVHGA